MKKLILFSFLLIGNFACQKQTIEPMVTLNGEWRYVGKFSQLADYKCYICEDFDYEKAIYTLKINGNGTLVGRINLLIAESDYIFKETKADISNSGSFSFKNFQILNKPWQTQSDTDYLKFIDEVTTYQLTTSTGAQPYDELDLGSGDEFLKFVRIIQKTE